MTQSCIHSRSEKQGRRSFGSGSLLLSFALLSLSCNSGDVAVRSDADTTSSPLYDSTEVAAVADTAEVSEIDIVTGPFSAPKPVGLTLGERLKQLDSLMQVVPADSLEVLMAEYDRLLDSAITGHSTRTPITTTEPSTQTTTPLASHESSEPPLPVAEDVPEPVVSEQTTTASATPREAETEEATEETKYTYSTPRSKAESLNSSEALVQSGYRNETSTFDPSQYKGARESELKYYEKHQASANKGSASGSASSTKKKTGSATSAKKGSSGRTTTTAAAPSGRTSSPTSSTPQRSSGQSLDEKYTNGLTHFRAGAYGKAIENLKPVAGSSKSYSGTARYYYGLALERTGSLSQAASQFRKLKSGSGSLADKSWIAYARVLNSLGKGSQAKSELLKFIKARPTSGQIGNARELLQRL